MPSQQEVRWSQLKVGVIVLVSVVILTTLLFLMTSASGLGFFSRKMTVMAYFPDASGLKVGAPVYLEGVTIGDVKSVSVTTSPDRKLTPVLVVMKVDSKYQPSLHADSTAQLATVGVLGDYVVNINSEQATGPPLRDGGELKTLEAPTIEDMVKSSQSTIDSLKVALAKVNTLVDNVQAGKGTVGQLMTNPEVYNKLAADEDDLHAFILKLNDRNNSIGKLLNDKGTTYDKVSDTLANIDSITADAQAGKGTLGKILKDPSMYDNLNASLASTKALLADAQAGKGGLGVALKDPKFAANLSDSLAKLDDLLTGVDAGKGTVGELFKEDTTANDLNKLLTNGNDLVTAIRQDPKKYLTIHMKIF